MLSRTEINKLLGRLASQKGCCEVPSNVFEGIPFTIDDYTRVILEAEGMDHSERGPIWRDVQQDVIQAFQAHQHSCDELEKGL